MGWTSLAGQIITWAITITVARMLTPGDYGLVALVGIFTVFASAVGDMGISAAVVQRQNATPSELSALYTLSILIGFGITAVGFLVAPLMAYAFSDQRLTRLVAFSSLVFLVGAAKSMQRTVLTREMRFDVIAKVDMASRIATSCCTLGLAASGCEYWAIAAQPFLFELFQFLLFSRIRRIVPSLRFKFAEIRELLLFGVHVLFRNLGFRLSSVIDTTILGKLASQHFLGAYGFAQQLTSMPFDKVVSIVNQVQYPYLARHQSDPVAIREWTLKTAELEALLIAPFFELLFFAAPEAVRILLGPTWSEAVFPLQIFCVASIFKLADSYNTTCLTALGKIAAQTWYMFAQVVVVGGTMLIIALTVNARTSVLVWVTVYPAMSIAFARVLTRTLNLSIPGVLWHLRTTLAAHVVLIGSLAAIHTQIHGSPWMTASIKCVVGALAYVATILLIDMPKAKRVLFLFLPRFKGQASNHDSTVDAAVSAPHPTEQS
jgi:O-antigen/teichoic acid export membrane protein